MLCRHCKQVPPSRPRGLCWSCYHRAGVRDRYPSVSKFGQRGVGAFNGGYEVPPPLAVLPGTPDKVAVLEHRAAQGLALWHPDDGIKEETGVFYIVGIRLDGSTLILEEKSDREAADHRRDDLAEQLEGYRDIVVQAAGQYEPVGKAEPPKSESTASKVESTDSPRPKEDRIKLLKERHEAMKANNNGLVDQELTDIIRQTGPLARFDDVDTQVKKERGTGVSKATFYKYKAAIFPDAPKNKRGPAPKPTASPPARTAPRSSTISSAPVHVADMKPLESLAEAIDVLGQVKTLIKRVGGADQLRELVNILA